MSALDALDAESPSEAKGRRGGKYTSKRKKNCVTVVDMPAREPTKFPSCALTRPVRLYPASTSSIYITEQGFE